MSAKDSNIQYNFLTKNKNITSFAMNSSQHFSHLKYYRRKNQVSQMNVIKKVNKLITLFVLNCIQIVS